MQGVATTHQDKVVKARTPRTGAHAAGEGEAVAAVMVLCQGDERAG